MATRVFEGRRGRVVVTTRARPGALTVRIAGHSDRHGTVHDQTYRLVGTGPADGAAGDRDGPAPGLHLVVPPRGRLIDLRGHPGALEVAAEDAVQVLEPARRAAALADVGRAVLAEVTAAAGRCGIALPEHPAAVGVAGVVGAAGLPMLRAALDAGAGPLATVPRWAVEPLAAPTARAAMLQAAGRAGTSRRSIAALAAALVPGVAGDGEPEPVVEAWQGTDRRGAVALFPLALVLMARDVLDPDRLARVLAPGLAASPPGSWPTVDEVELARRWLPRWGAARATTVLRDAATRPDGPILLADTVLLHRAVVLAGVVPTDIGRLASRLGPLHDQLLAHLPADPVTPADGPAALRGTTLHDRPRPAHHAPARRAPAGRGPERPPLLPPPARVAAPLPPAPEEPDIALDGATPLRFPAEILRLHGRTVGSLRIVVPRTAFDLRHWGRSLGNCIGLYAGRAAAGATWLLGVEREGRLHYAVEIHPDRWVRQFVGPRNAPPDVAEGAAVLDILVDEGVIPRRAAVLPQR